MTSLKGQILLSQPFMDDPYFKKTTVFLCEHSEEGTVGLILNRPVDTLIDELVPDFPDFEDTVFYGGPVGADTLHYIHNIGSRLHGSVEVSPGIFWGGDFEQLKSMISDGIVKPDDINFYVGYSGWSAGQLEEEMSARHWMTHLANPKHVFNGAPDSLWSTIMTAKGSTFKILSELPETINN